MNLPVLSCDGCGVCCFHMGYPAFNLSLEVMQGYQEFDGPSQSTAARDWTRWTQLPDRLRSELIELAKDHRPDGSLDGPCSWLDPDTRRCRHHEYRPQVCRDFEIGCQQCLDWRQAYQDQIKPV